MSIRDKKLLYHLTSLENVELILENGLLPRNQVQNFTDVADPDIIQFRGENDLNSYVPFHFFPKNPFDGRVQIDHPDIEFVYVTIHRKVAQNDNFSIIPQHPISMPNFRLYDYDEGIDEIRWDLMDLRDFNNDLCKQICMAECICPGRIEVNEFHCIYVKDEETRDYVRELANDILGTYSFYIDVASYMFLE